MTRRLITRLALRLLKLAGWERVEVMKRNREPEVVVVLRVSWCRCERCRGK